MRSFASPMWPAAVVLALGLLALAGPAVPAAEAQAGGTLVLGLDQEPPTLDPHASPSAQDYCALHW